MIEVYFLSPPPSPPPFSLSDSEVDIEEDEPVNEVSVGMCVHKTIKNNV